MALTSTAPIWRAALAASVLLGLGGCVGMSAPYPATEGDLSVDLIPVTPKLVADQLAAAKEAVNAGNSLQTSPKVADYRYIIRPGDVLQISVPSIVSFNSTNAPSILGEQGQSYTVYDDGTIFLPYSGSVQISGLSIKQAQESVVHALSSFLRSPQVIVEVKEFRSQRIMITGQVQKPGYVPITDIPLTLVGALSSVGGAIELRGSGDPRPLGTQLTQNVLLGEYPDLSNVILRRSGISYSVNVRKILATGDVSNDPLLLDGDVVVVPPVRRTNIFVLGEVVRPGLMEVNRESAALADVLQASGGINQLTANASRVYVIRGDYKKPTVYQIDAGHPDSMLLAQNFKLQPNDVVYVAEAQATRFNRGLQQILPTIQGLVSTAVIANTFNELNN